MIENSRQYLPLQTDFLQNSRWLPLYYLRVIVFAVDRVSVFYLVVIGRSLRFCWVSVKCRIKVYLFFLKNAVIGLGWGYLGLGLGLVSTPTQA